MPGTVEVAGKVFAMPVRIGVPGEGLAGLADSVRRPKYATAAGLALYGADRLLASGSTSGLAQGAVGRIVGWIRDFF